MMSNRDFSVIICAYTEQRWTDLVAAMASIQAQSLIPYEIILVIDHNPSLFQRAKHEFPGVIVIENHGMQGLSGARNSGIAIASGEIFAFMDEDAMATLDWLEHLADKYQDPGVLGVGGAIIPVWADGKPGWFPSEFNWVVGCTYRGMPTKTAPVRNMIGCNMSFRREIFDNGEVFREGIGRIGLRPLGCEETELCIRAGKSRPDGYFLYDPEAEVEHRVPKARKSFRYFISRCYSEGLSKAQISQLVGTDKALASERTYTFHTLPAGVLRGIQDVYKEKSLYGLMRSISIIIGLAFTTFGYIWGNLLRKLFPSESENSSMGRDNPKFSSKNEIFKPFFLNEVELSQPIPAIQALGTDNGAVYQRVRSCVRLHGLPLGVIDLELQDGHLSAEEFANRIWNDLSKEIDLHLHSDGLQSGNFLSSEGLTFRETPKCEQERNELLKYAQPVSIVIATHDRTESLAATLDSLLKLDYSDYEIIVVDNAPSTDTTSKLISTRYHAFEQIRYIREDQPGLAVAHNRGLQEVNAPIVVFTDDDVLVDKIWLKEIAVGFGMAADVGCVCGAILPVEIETQQQDWIESLWGLSKGFHSKIFHLSNSSSYGPLFPYTAGQFGSGANMAFRTSLLRELGGFDPALGAGSKALGGDDLAAFFHIVKSGHTLVYQPSAIVYHRHRRSYDDLRKLVYGYGVGLTAYLTSVIVNNPELLFDMIMKLPSGIRYAFGLRSPQGNKKGSYPRELSTRERIGMLHGSFAYLRSRWHTRSKFRINPKNRTTLDSIASPTSAKNVGS